MTCQQEEEEYTEEQLYEWRLAVATERRRLFGRPIRLNPKGIALPTSARKLSDMRAKEKSYWD